MADVAYTYYPRGYELMVNIDVSRGLFVPASTQKKIPKKIYATVPYETKRA